MATNSAKASRYLNSFISQEEPPEEESLISRILSGAKDVGTEIVKDVAAVPGRVAAIPELAARKAGVGFTSSTQEKELRSKALGGAFDVASFLFPAGRIAKAAGLAGKGIAKTAGRGALAAVKTSPLITPRETASDPVARAKDVAFQSTIGAAAPVITSKIISPVAAKAQAGISNLFKKSEAARNFRLTQNIKEKTVKNFLSSKGITAASREDYPALVKRMLKQTDEVLGQLDEAEQILLAQSGPIAVKGTFQGPRCF